MADNAPPTPSIPNPIQGVQTALNQPPPETGPAPGQNLFDRIKADFQKNPALWIGVIISFVILIVAVIALRRNGGGSAGAIPAGGAVLGQGTPVDTTSGGNASDLASALSSWMNSQNAASAQQQNLLQQILGAVQGQGQPSYPSYPSSGPGPAGTPPTKKDAASTTKADQVRQKKQADEQNKSLSNFLNSGSGGLSYPQGTVARPSLTPAPVVMPLRLAQPVQAAPKTAKPAPTAIKTSGRVAF